MFIIHFSFDREILKSGPGFEMISLGFVNGPQFKGHLLDMQTTLAGPKLAKPSQRRSSLKVSPHV